MRVCDCEKADKQENDRQYDNRRVEKKFYELVELDSKCKILIEREERYLDAINYFKNKNVSKELKESFKLVEREYEGLKKEVEDVNFERNCCLVSWKNDLVYSKCTITDDYLVRILKDVGKNNLFGIMTLRLMEEKVNLKLTVSEYCEKTRMYIDMVMAKDPSKQSRLTALKQLIKMYDREVFAYGSKQI